MSPIKSSIGCVVKFGLAYARKLRRSHPPADTRWHLDEVFVSINGRSMYLWRAVDCEGEVLDVLVQSRRNKRTALKLMRKLLKTQGFVPAAIVTDNLPSYGAALNDLGMKGKHITGGLGPCRLVPTSVRMSVTPSQRLQNCDVTTGYPAERNAIDSVHDPGITVLCANKSSRHHVHRRTTTILKSPGIQNGTKAVAFPPSVTSNSWQRSRFEFLAVRRK